MSTIHHSAIKHSVPTFLLALILSGCPNKQMALEINEGRAFALLELKEMRGIAIDKEGNLYLPDNGAGTLYKVTPEGKITELHIYPAKTPFAVAIDGNGTIALCDPGNSEVFLLDGQNDAVQIAPYESKELFHGVTSVAFDGIGNLYAGINDANIVRIITPEGEISILAGANKQRGNKDGIGPHARIDRPRGLAVDEAGNVYLADDALSVIRKITPEGVVATIAGSPGEIGSVDGPGKESRFARPRGLAVDGSGNIFVMDTENHTIRKITPAGTVTTFAGKAGEPGFVDGIGSEARFSGPRAATVDAEGNIYVADEDNSAVRMISPNGRVTTVVAP